MIFHKHGMKGRTGNRNIEILEFIQEQIPEWHIIDTTYQFRIKAEYKQDTSNMYMYEETMPNRRLLVHQQDPGAYLENNEVIDQLGFTKLPLLSDTTCDWNFWAWMYNLEKDYYNLKPIPMNLKDDFNHFMFFNKKAPLHRKHAIEHILKDKLDKYGVVTVDDGDMYMNFEGNDSTTADGGHGGSQLSTTGRAGPGDGGLGNNDIWSNTFCYIVGETTHSDRFLSEKSWKPIIGKRPFLHLHKEKIKVLQDMGFKTFSTLWDEERDWFEILGELCTLDAHTLNVMYDSVQDILDYNHDYFFGEFQKNNLATLKKYISNL